MPLKGAELIYTIPEENGRIVGHIGAVENCVVLSEKGQPQRVVYNLWEED